MACQIGRFHSSNASSPKSKLNDAKAGFIFASQSREHLFKSGLSRFDKSPVCPSSHFSALTSFRKTATPRKLLGEGQEEPISLLRADLVGRGNVDHPSKTRGSAFFPVLCYEWRDSTHLIKDHIQRKVLLR